MRSLFILLSLVQYGIAQNTAQDPAQGPTNNVAPAESRVRTSITRAEFRPLTGGERWSLYWRETFGSPGLYFASFGIASGDQRNHQPAQWGQGFGPYMQRTANEFARLTLEESITAGGAALLHQDTRYVKCGCSGVFRRAGHAIAMNFVALNDSGQFRPNYARFAGAAGAQYIANTWMPRGYRNWDTSLRDAGLQIGIDAGFNLVREFVPARKPKK